MDRTVQDIVNLYTTDENGENQATSSLPDIRTLAESDVFADVLAHDMMIFSALKTTYWLAI